MAKERTDRILGASLSPRLFDAFWPAFSQRPAISQWLLVSVILLWMTTMTAVPSFGQFGPDDEGLEEGPSQILMLAPREYQQRLKQAERSIQDEEYSDAIEILESFLRPSATPGEGGTNQEDYFLGRPGEAQLRGSLRTEARRLLGSLPEAGKEIYRLQYAADADRLLEKALSEHDVESLSVLSRQYFHTPAGHLATMLLGQHQLDLGQGLSASMYLTRLLEDKTAQAQFDPQLSLQAARSWLLANQPQRAEKVLLELQQRMPGAEFSIAGKTVSLFSAGESPLEWLQKVAPANAMSTSRPVDEWTLHRGVPSRNPVTTGGRILPRMRWRVPVANDPDDEEILRDLEREYREESAAPLATISPLVVGDVVLLRTPQHLLAVDFATGKRIWEFPWADDVAAVGSSNSRIPARREVHRAQLEERLCFDSVYGQLTSDGQSVFLLDELPYVTADMGQMINNGFRNLGVDLAERLRSFNYLVALELRSQGKYRWRVGGPSGEDEPRLANAFFLGAPLVIGEELYVMAEIRGDISLFVLSAETGKYRWSQQLAHVGVSDIQMDNLRRLAGATPSYADGVLLCPTSAGALVAVDIANRGLLWGHQYPRSVVAQVRGPRLNQFYALTQPFTRDRWSDSAALIGNGRVIVTPIEADQLFCLDLLTGKLLWSFSREGEWLHAAGIHGPHVILVGKSKVAAFQLDTGTKDWELSLRNDESLASQSHLPSGRGFISGSSYFLPIHDRLVEIDLKQGTKVSDTNLAEPLGHLICHQDEVLSVTPSALSVFHQRARLAERVAQRLAKNPEDAWALEHSAILRLDEGDRSGALEALRKSYAAYAPNDDRREGTKQLLVETLLDALEATNEATPELLEEVDQLIDRPLQRERYLRLVGQQWLRQGDATRSFQAFMKLAASPASSHLLTSFEDPDQPLQTITPGYLVRRDRLIRSGIQAAWNTASTEQRAEIEPEILATASRVLQAGSVHSMRDFLSTFADHPIANQVRVALANRYLENKDYLLAEQTLFPLLDKRTLPEAPVAWFTLARVMQDSQQWDAAADCWRELLTQWPQSVLHDGLTAQQLWEQVSKHQQLKSRFDREPRWQYGRVHVEPKSANPTNLSTQFQPQSSLRPIRLLEMSGPLKTRLRVAHDTTGGNHLVVQDAFGNPRVTVPSSMARGVNRHRDGSMYYKSSGHLLLVNQGHTIVAIDALDPESTPEERVLWPPNYREILAATAGSIRSSVRSSTPKANEWGQIIHEVNAAIGPMTHEGTVLAQSNMLMCVDTLHGDTIWSRPLPQSDPVIWGDSEIVLVSGKSINEVTVYRMLDGAELGRRPLPDANRRWSTFGRWLLTWDQQLDQGQAIWRLRLWDPWTNEERWSRLFPAVSKGNIQPDGTLAVVEASGKLTIMDALTGSTLVEDQLEPSQRTLQAVHLLSSRDQWLVVRGFDPVAANRGTMIDSLDSFTAPLVDGEIYAYLRSTGRRQWQMPAVIEAYGLPLDQPDELPVLAFQRQVSAVGRQGRRPSNELGIIVLDRRDGRLIFEADRLNFTTPSFGIAGNPEEQTVSLRASNQNHYLLRLTSEPQPPAPPAQTGAAASRGKGTVFSKIFSAALNGLSRGVEKQGRQAEEEIDRMLNEEDEEEEAEEAEEAEDQ